MLIYGCMDSFVNFNEGKNIDDGSCNSGCTDSEALLRQIKIDDGTCDYTEPIFYSLMDELA